MNKKAFLAVAVIVVVIILGIIIFLLMQKKPVAPANTTQTTFPMATSTSVATSEAPANFVRDFFAWYLSVGENLNSSNYASFNQELSQWITPEFQSQMNTIIENTDESPFVLSQDIPPDWSSNIATQLVTASTTSAVINVTLGTASDQQNLQVTVVPVNGEWRISSVTTP